MSHCETRILLAIFAAWGAVMLLFALALALSIIQRRRDIRRMQIERRRT